MMSKIEINSCRFCWPYSQKQILIKEGVHAYIILSNPRLIPGHLLVIPKRHVEKFSELSAQEHGEINNLLAEFIDKTLKYSSAYSIHHNYMPVLPESQTKVNHLHIHIWPREKNDEFYETVLKYEHTLFKPLSEEEIGNICASFLKLFKTCLLFILYAKNL